MSDHSHRGAKPPGPFSQSPDRRVLELDEALRNVEALSGALPAFGLFRDSTRAAQARQTALGGVGDLARGTVIHVLPYVNWYKVQTSTGGWVSACCLSGGTLMPLGARDIGMVGPNDDVLLFRPKGLNYSYILGVIPPATSNAVVSCPDWVVQAGGSGLKREAGHKYPIKNLYKGGGVIDWSAQRPQDQTPLERGWITSSGLTLTIDDGLIQVRVNEMTGLWMTLFDGWLRLAGEQLLIESTVHEEESGDDEGEARHFRGVATYPHEALGQYAPGQPFGEEVDDKAVQYDSPRAKVDLKEGEEDTQPIYRYQEFGGYHGQGHLRLVVKPGGTTGVRQYGEVGDPDYGMFMESIGLNGAYALLFAKSGHIGKRVKISVPRQIAPPQAAGGDDAVTGTYKFSSLFGSGPDHIVGDVIVTGTPRSMVRVTAVADLVSYDLNWRALHPFHYHVGDYRLPQQSEMSEFSGNTATINFGADDFYTPDPAPKRLRIDHRYGEVEYFERESFIHWHDDGTLHLSGGAGEEIVLGGGRVRIAAPHGVDICPGGEFAVKAEQVVICAKGSIDLSSSERDVRIKAENNMQLLAGNSGTGGMLLESRGTGTAQQYRNRFGEDVEGSGVVVRASSGTVALLGQDIYLRTGGRNLGEGDILLDASRGKRRVQVFGHEFNTYTSQAVTFNFGPLESTSDVRRSYYFSETTSIMDARLLLGGTLIGYTGGGGNAGIVVDGDIRGTGSFATSGVMANKAGVLNKVPAGFSGTITTVTSAASQAAKKARDDSTVTHQTTVVEKYYQNDQIGDDEQIGFLSFGFRDPPGTPRQYRTASFLWPESRWQQMARFGLGSGGVGWRERPVIYQGRQTYPWPGKTKLVDEPTLLRLTEPVFFDPATGQDKDRPYENPVSPTAEPVTLNENYTLIR